MPRRQASELSIPLERRRLETSLTWLRPRHAPLIISKPVTPLRSLVRPLIRAPYTHAGGLPNRSAPLPAFEIPKRALKAGAPAAPNPCAKGRNPLESPFSNPHARRLGRIAIPPCRTPPGKSVPDTALPENHARWDFHPPPLHCRFSPVTLESSVPLRQAKFPTGVRKSGKRLFRVSAWKYAKRAVKF